MLKPETRNKLMAVSTATLCTALFKRGLRNQFIQDVRPLNPNLPNMVGEAYTLRYMPAREDLNTIEVFKNRAHPQRKAVEECPPGAVLVIDSRKDARAASAGSILVTRLMKRGVAASSPTAAFATRPRSHGSTSRRTTAGPARRPTSRCTRRSTSTCRSAAATRRCSPATWSSAMPKAWS